MKRLCMTVRFMVSDVCVCCMNERVTCKCPSPLSFCSSVGLRLNHLVGVASGVSFVDVFMYSVICPLYLL